MINLLDIYEQEKLTYKQASIIYKELMESKETLETLLNKYNFTQKYEDNKLSSIIDEILLEYIDAVNDYKNGKDKALNYLLGQIYKKTHNNVDSLNIKEMLLNKLEEK